MLIGLAAPKFAEPHHPAGSGGPACRKHALETPFSAYGSEGPHESQRPVTRNNLMRESGANAGRAIAGRTHGPERSGWVSPSPLRFKNVCANVGSHGRKQRT